MNTRLKNFILQIFRKSTFKWYTRQIARNAAKRQVGAYSTGRPKYMWECALCKQLFKAKDTVMDHVDPVVPLQGYKSGKEFDLEECAERMFPLDADKWNCLCSPCHDAKTKEENKIRREYKKTIKEKKL